MTIINMVSKASEEGLPLPSVDDNLKRFTPWNSLSYQASPQTTGVVVDCNVIANSNKVYEFDKEQRTWTTYTINLAIPSDSVTIGLTPYGYFIYSSSSTLHYFYLKKESDSYTLTQLTNTDSYTDETLYMDGDECYYYYYGKLYRLIFQETAFSTALVGQMSTSYGYYLIAVYSKEDMVITADSPGSSYTRVYFHSLKGSYKTKKDVYSIYALTGSYNSYGFLRARSAKRTYGIPYMCKFTASSSSAFHPYTYTFGLFGYDSQTVYTDTAYLGQTTSTTRIKYTVGSGDLVVFYIYEKRGDYKDNVSVAIATNAYAPFIIPLTDTTTTSPPFLDTETANFGGIAKNGQMVPTP